MIIWLIRRGTNVLATRAVAPLHPYRHPRFRRHCRCRVFGGFLWFADSVATMRPPEGARADAIIVLTGGYQRIDQAVGLLRDKVGKRLLISGVNPSTTRAQIRRMTQSSPDLFACCVDMGYKAIDTIGNANEAAGWIRDKGYTSIVVVTNNYHMHRSLHELRSASPNTEFIAYPSSTRI